MHQLPLIFVNSTLLLTSALPQTYEEGRLPAMSRAAVKLDPSVNLAEHIEKIPLFKGISLNVLQPFIESASLRKEKKGKLLFIQGDPAPLFFFVLSGWVKLFRETIDGTEAVIDVLTSGHLFGETAVFENNAYAYSAEIVEDAQIIPLPNFLLSETIKENNQLALNMLASMSRHGRQQDREIEHLTLQNASQRIGCFLLRLCPTETPGSVTLNLPYDKTLIASRLGMKPETFSRALAKLKNETPIEISGPTVKIRQLDGLISYTCNNCSHSFPCEDLKI